MRGWEIKARRKAAGLSQAELAEDVEVGQPTVSTWETDRAIPSASQLQALERILSEQRAGATSPSQDYGEWLYDRRRAARLSQTELAESVGVTQTTVSAWERARASPTASQQQALELVMSDKQHVAATSPSQDYGEWLQGRRTVANLSREQLAARSGVSAVAIYNIETGRTINPRSTTRDALESELKESAPQDIIQAVEASAEIRDVGRMTDFDPHSDEDYPREPGVYVFYDISDRPIYVGMSKDISRRIRRDHRDRFWYKSPIVEKAAYVCIRDETLRGQLETTLIKFLKSNAVINQQNVDR